MLTAHPPRERPGRTTAGSGGRGSAPLDVADRRLRTGMVRALARAAEPIYATALSLRNAAYDHGLLRAARVDRPVISVGNLTAGGTGKTPMVCHVCRVLLAAGRSPAVVLRGYRPTSAGASDEASMLAEALPTVPIVTHPDRSAAARALCREHPSVDTIVLDDAFQHRRVHRDLDLVLIDATAPFGGDHLLPRGLLRERPAALRRADAVVVTRSDRVAAGPLARLDGRIERLHGGAPLAHATCCWEGLLDAADAPVDPSGASVVAFCGVGNPAPFFDRCGEMAAVARALAFPDHHDYTIHDLERVLREASAADADALVTTEKDWVKLRRLLRSRRVDWPIWRPHVSLRFPEGGDRLDRKVLVAAGTDPGSPHEAPDRPD